MPTPFQRALANAAKTQARLAGESVVYRAGNVTIAIADAVPGATDSESTSETGVMIRSKVTDWLIFVARLVSNSVAIEPQPGHRIEHTVSGVKRVYEVQNLGDEECYRFAGPVRDRYRIHVREIPGNA